ncbi:MAG: hypothetical protein M3499_00615 [Actinomycetota bacterium]|nr:hypothetical protein [Actinomycetota bacterium]
MNQPIDLGVVTFSQPGEQWIEFGPPSARRRVGFHDYDALYTIPGLYERVFYDLLGMRTADVVVELYASALAELGCDPSAERVLDLGAGTGKGGELMRAVGVAQVIGVDVEPAARDATERDRPGVYDEFYVADLATASPSTMRALQRHEITSMVALASIGVGHITVELLADLITTLIPPSGLVAFAVADQLLPDFHTNLFSLVPVDVLTSTSYVHRLQTDGSPHRATAVVIRRSHL